MLEFLIELVVELLFQGIGEAVVEGVARLLGAPFGRRDREHPVAAGAGLLMLGAVAGWVSWLVYPYRVMGVGPFPGLSLLVSPIVNGRLADALGTWRERHGRPRTYLSSFWGGALFALGVAAVRFWLVPGFPSLSDLPLER